jgi:hypothetical protein
VSLFTVQKNDRIRARQCVFDLITDSLTQCLSSELSILSDQGWETIEKAYRASKDGLMVMEED